MKKTISSEANEHPTSIFSSEQMALVVAIAKQAVRDEMAAAFLLSPAAPTIEHVEESRALRRNRKNK